MDMKQPPMNRSAGTSAAAEAPALAPAVDVFEDEHGITVKADMPGVSKENLHVRVDGDTLTLEGQVQLGTSGALEPVYAEVRVANYRRTFALSRDLDTEKIDARIRNGVLTLQMPKREQAKARRIEVTAA